jgi:hypothetical protein
MCISKETREAQYKPQSNILYKSDPQFQRLPRIVCSSKERRYMSPHLAVGVPRKVSPMFFEDFIPFGSFLYSFLGFLYRVADKFHILLPTYHEVSEVDTSKTS